LKGWFVDMEKFWGWWKQDKRYVTLIKSLSLALLPLLCCLVYCAMQGRRLGEVYLPSSEWNDELFYYKQVEGIVRYGYPLGYFGFNESHALKLSFAAWSPVLVFPWVIWGWIFGWNLMSPVICNIFLMSLCCFLFVWLVKPAWKQLGILALLFCLYTPFVRYMLSAMPEVICFSMLIIFYGLAINYLHREAGYKLVLLFVISGVMTLMRPYLVLFMLLPAWFWVRRSRWKGALGSLAVLAAVLGVYACIKHYLGAAYFAPLFFTDWVSAFWEQGLFGGIHFTLGKLYYMGKSFYEHTLQGFRTGLASGAFFAGFLVCMCVLIGQSLRDWRVCRKRRREADFGIGVGKQECEAESMPGAERRRREADSGIDSERQGRVPRRPVSGLGELEPAAGGQSAKAGREKQEKGLSAGGLLVIEAHLAFSFVAMFFALLLMYKLTEGSKHLLTFMAAAIFVIALMETKFYKKAVLVGITFAYFYSYMAVDPYDYQVPFVQEERLAAVEQWRETLAGELAPDRAEAPGYGNVVIWVLYDKVGESSMNTQWQLLYALPEGYGISCCMPEYVEENFGQLQSRYICTLPGGSIEDRCIRADYRKVAESRNAVLYQRY